MISKVIWHPKFNLDQLNAYNLILAIKLSNEKGIKFFLAAWFSDLLAINTTVFRFGCVTNAN